MQYSRKNQRGMTVIEILVVLVVIAILSTISVMVYTKVQAGARDDKRKADIASIAGALERYYRDNGEYPLVAAGSGASATIDDTWYSSSAPTSWDKLKTALVPKYLSEMPVDPLNTTAKTSRNGGFSYDFFSNRTGLPSYCDAGVLQMYLLTYRLEGTDQENSTLQGVCTGTQLKVDGISNYRNVRKNT